MKQYEGMLLPVAISCCYKQVMVLQYPVVTNKLW